MKRKTIVTAVVAVVLALGALIAGPAVADTMPHGFGVNTMPHADGTATMPHAAGSLTMPRG